MSQEEQRWGLKYDLAFESSERGFKRSELGEQGGTDALVFVSVVRGPKAHDGSKSFKIISFEGWADDPQPMRSTELLQVAASLIDTVVTSPRTNEKLRAHAKELMDIHRMFMAELRAK